MFTGIFPKMGVVTTGTAFLLGAAILRVGAAVADPNQDQEFLAALDREGVSALENVPSVIAAAHRVCRELDGGIPADEVVNRMTTFANGHEPSGNLYPRERLTRTFTRFVSVAVEVYCPRHQGKVASVANALPGANNTAHPIAAYNTVVSGSGVRDRRPVSALIDEPGLMLGRVDAHVVRLPGSTVVAIFPAWHDWVDRSDDNTASPIPALPIDGFAAGETIAPAPPQVPTPLPPPANILMPPRAPAPARQQQPPPPPQQPPSPPQQPPPPPQQPPPPPEQPPPPPEQPPQQMQPPAAAPQPGAGGGGGGLGGSGGGGGGGSGGSGGGLGGGDQAGPASPGPMPPGVIRVLP